MGQPALDKIYQDNCGTRGQISNSSSSSSSFFFFPLKLSSYPLVSSLYLRVDILVVSIITLNFALEKLPKWIELISL